MGNQWREINTGVISSRLGCKETMRAAVFNTRWSFEDSSLFKFTRREIAVVYSSWYKAVDKCGVWILNEMSSDLANASKVKKAVWQLYCISG